MKLLVNFKEALDKGNSVIAIFMDLSKAFDILNHDLLLTKLEAYGLFAISFSYIHSYLTKRLQKTNVSSNFDLWKEVFSRVPQRSILITFIQYMY